jgi:hypothetical protein
VFIKRAKYIPGEQCGDGTWEFYLENDELLFRRTLRDFFGNNAYMWIINDGPARYFKAMDIEIKESDVLQLKSDEEFDTRCLFYPDWKNKHNFADKRFALVVAREFERMGWERGFRYFTGKGTLL